MQGANYEAIYLTKEALFLEIPGRALSESGSWDTTYTMFSNTSFPLPGQTFSQFSVLGPRIAVKFIFHRNCLLFLKKLSAGQSGGRKQFKAPTISMKFLRNHTEPQESFLSWENLQTYEVWQISVSYRDKCKNAVTTIKNPSHKTEQIKKITVEFKARFTGVWTRKEQRQGRNELQTVSEIKNPDVKKMQNGNKKAVIQAKKEKSRVPGNSGNWEFVLWTKPNSKSPAWQQPDEG